LVDNLRDEDKIAMSFMPELQEKFYLPLVLDKKKIFMMLLID